jgi:hypothetical protein
MTKHFRRIPCCVPLAVFSASPARTSCPCRRMSAAACRSWYGGRDSRQATEASLSNVARKVGGGDRAHARPLSWRRMCDRIAANLRRRASGTVSAASGEFARLPEEQLEQLDELRPRASARPQDLERSGRICNDSLGQSKDGEAPADVLVAKRRSSLTSGAVRHAG